MRALCLLLLLAQTLPAGVIGGVVLDWASGKPLSRTVVTLTPVPGTNAKQQQVRSGRSGQFQFIRIPDGLYILQTQREGFLPAAHGQRRPTGHGTPITVSRDSSLFSELRLHRMGALTGTVLDENGIGIPGVQVVAYRARLPLRVAGHGQADDRGIFRIAGLELGKYWVRSASHRLDDGTGLLPMFGPEAREPRDAVAHEVRFDNDTVDANVRPEPGQLSVLSGLVACDRAGAAVSLILSSEVLRRTVQTGCGAQYQFVDLPPAVYELYGAYTDGAGSGFFEISLSQNTQLPLQLTYTDPTYFEIQAPNRQPLRTPVAIIARRDDLSGLEPPFELPTLRPPLPAGHFEFSATAGPNQYVVSIASMRGDARRPWRAIRPPEGFPVYIEPRAPNRVRVVISDRAASLSGVVSESGKPAPGMPVFLWPVKEDTRRMLGPPRQLLSDKDGRFTFTGLPPGDYRVVSTMDAREPTAELMEESHAPTVTLAEGQSTQVELALWLAP